MIYAVSPVSFKAAGAQAQRSAADRLYDPQRFQMPEAQAKSKKKHGFLKALGWIVATAAVVAGLLYAGNKTQVFEKLMAKDNALLKKSGEYLDIAGKWVAEKGALVVDKAKEGVNWVVSKFKSLKKPAEA